MRSRRGGRGGAAGWGRVRGWRSCRARQSGPAAGRGSKRGGPRSAKRQFRGGGGQAVSRRAAQSAVGRGNRADRVRRGCHEQRHMSSAQARAGRSWTVARLQPVSPQGTGPWR
ncbi:hypothetical protein CesoFtcFv8_019276 [Champsocephalus esox]|uniref:Uncharacterized protein n=1 Tax=Champsocephalus esox TaxID=159716 RepID=A0AAN8GPG9_9TELE|nr:hypothetical protein CesoFtcFv8_019276 [Champsocephalus esox]